MNTTLLLWLVVSGFVLFTALLVYQFVVCCQDPENEPKHQQKPVTKNVAGTGFGIGGDEWLLYNTDDSSSEIDEHQQRLNQETGSLRAILSAPDDHHNLPTTTSLTSTDSYSAPITHTMTWDQIHATSAQTWAGHVESSHEHKYDEQQQQQQQQHTSHQEQQQHQHQQQQQQHQHQQQQQQPDTSHQQQQHDASHQQHSSFSDDDFTQHSQQPSLTESIDIHTLHVAPDISEHDPDDISHEISHSHVSMEHTPTESRPLTPHDEILHDTPARYSPSISSSSPSMSLIQTNIAGTLRL